MLKTLKYIVPAVAFLFFSCDKLQPKSYPLNSLTAKQETKLLDLLDGKTDKGEGIYKVRFDTINQHTVLNFMYSDYQTDLSELEAFLLDQNLINKSYIPKVELDSMVRAKEVKDSLKKIEEEEEKRKSEKFIEIPRESDKVKEVMQDSTEEGSNSTEIPSIYDVDITEKLDSL